MDEPKLTAYLTVDKKDFVSLIFSQHEKFQSLARSTWLSTLSQPLQNLGVSVVSVFLGFPVYVIHMMQDETTPAPRILFIDAYDSFSHNIVALVEQALDAVIETVFIDDPRFISGEARFRRFLADFDAVIAGPGPGNPCNSADVGLIARLWALDEPDILPVLGICLGFQSLALAYGAQIERLKEPRHGIITRIEHSGRSIYRGVGHAEATQYHSLRATVGCTSSISDDRIFNGVVDDASLLEILALDRGGPPNGNILMAIRHREKPFYGVQYHPESICTDGHGLQIVKNWWFEASLWNATKRTSHSPTGVLYKPHVSLENANNAANGATHLRILRWEELGLGDITVFSLRDFLEDLCTQTIILQSGTRDDGKSVNNATGRFTILGCTENHVTELIHYRVLDKRIDRGPAGETAKPVTGHCNIWAYLETYMTDHRVVKGPSVSPFWGGLIGFISYEAGLETINVTPTTSKETQHRPDISFAHIERSVVVDHLEKQIYIQSCRQNDNAWVESVKTTLSKAQNDPEARERQSLAGTANMVKLKVESTFEKPPKLRYISQIRSCQESIRAGNSYELCLTDQTTVKVPSNPRGPSSWTLYRRLQALNPSPFSAYVRLGQTTIISSSPERFLSWTRDGLCQYRPIKGTVKKGSGMTREKAEEILKSAKERAENLMIVDLIRHDLHGVVGSGNVEVVQLMGMEEYETVWQLVSVIEGRLPRSIAADAAQRSTEGNAATTNSRVPEDQQSAHSPAKTGLSVLAASLPPGSMTGAPKKRSCEILQALEGPSKPRGVYSGVLGYLDFGGGGDFSVVIRSAVKWDDESEHRDENGVTQGHKGEGDGKTDVWTVGAGGAITALSNEEAEWEEMCAKSDATLRMFGAEELG